jgi:hypothetical protein
MTLDCRNVARRKVYSGMNIPSSRISPDSTCWNERAKWSLSGHDRFWKPHPCPAKTRKSNRWRLHAPAIEPPAAV